MSVPAVIIDVDALLDVIVASAAAGIGITAVFGLVIYSTTRFADHRRAGRPVAATVFGVLSGLGLAAFVGAVALALFIMTDK